MSNVIDIKSKSKKQEKILMRNYVQPKADFDINFLFESIEEDPNQPVQGGFISSKGQSVEMIMIPLERWERMVEEFKYIKDIYKNKGFCDND